MHNMSEMKQLEYAGNWESLLLVVVFMARVLLTFIIDDYKLNMECLETETLLIFIIRFEFSVIPYYSDGFWRAVIKMGLPKNGKL